MNLKYQTETRNTTASGKCLPVWLAGISLALLISCSSAQAQFSNVEYFQNLDQSSSPSATDILSRKTTVGRFGSVSRGGWLAPSPNTNRRFSEGAVYTPSGAFVGLSTNSSNSRFQSWWNESQTLPRADYSIYSDFLSMKRGTNSDTYTMSAAQQRQASAPQPFPYPTRTPQTGSPSETRPSVPSQPQSEPIRTPVATQQVWMRGNLPAHAQNDLNRAETKSDNIQTQTTQSTQAPAAYPRNDLQPPLYPNSMLRSENRQLAQTPKLPTREPVARQPQEPPRPGAIQSTISPQDASQSLMEQQRYEQRRLAGTTIQQLQTQEAASVESIQSSLEQLLVRNPGVKPLSPIQVQLRDGIATVRGVVPSQTHRVEAGRVLLSDPRVKTVNNQLTVLPTNSRD